MTPRELLIGIWPWSLPDETASQGADMVLKALDKAGFIIMSKAEIERLKAAIKHGEQLIYESGLRLGEMSRECAELRTENDIMRRHLNLHPDKPLGNELRDEIASLRAALQRIADYDGTHGESVRALARAALEPKP